MHLTSSLFYLAALAPAFSQAQKGFHLMDRHAFWFYDDAVDCGKRAECGNIRAPYEYDRLWLVPSDNYNCGVIRDNNYDEGIRFASNIGHGTVIKGQCGSRSITLYPVNNGQELEVWESGGSRLYGKCYRQSPNKVLNCDSPDDGKGCSHKGQIVGPPVNGSCKIKATGVWVCPVDLCG
ncbi:hypothetical protein QBC35DRAFT_446604 [Podospora australis]|uniref:Secreted protein n=1 Tax=Podospora australis TaxID=1536484 RepID=A0AAN7ANC5_9PEZI|nr:hypothetical protein QBC35DRAFT_446604 [Podospora australis]